MEPPAAIAALVAGRAEARAAKDFGRADRLRAEILEAGWRIRDTAGGCELVPVPVVALLDHAGAEADLRHAPDRFDLSLCLLADAHEADLRRCLASFAAHLAGAAAEAVVVDVSPAGVDPEPLAGTGLPLLLLRLHQDPGFGAARNVALRQATGRVVVLADTSVEVTGPWAAPLLARLAEPGVTLAGPSGVRTTDMRTFTEAEGEVDAIEGYLLAFRRELTREVLFDARFRWYRNADLDLSYALREAAGGTARTVPLGLVHHEHRGWNQYQGEERASLSRRNFRRFLENRETRGVRGGGEVVDPLSLPSGI